MSPLIVALTFVAYIIISRLALRFLRGTFQDVVFSISNILAAYIFLFYGHESHYLFRFAVYLALVSFQYLTLRSFGERKGYLPWIPFFIPIFALIFFRYIPDIFYVKLGRSLGLTWQMAPRMVGISYLAFRASHLVLQVRNNLVKMPGFWRYLGFCFFLPTIPVGPINPYSNFEIAFRNPGSHLPVSTSAMRILIGLIKFQFLGPLCNRLTYSGLLLDQHPHSWIDLPVAILTYYLYLYCNFSGFCDMAIGISGIIGVPVAENFDAPLTARNVREFWNRWHITLSHYMRDVAFTPLSKYFTRLFGPGAVNHAIALTILIVFLIIGIWHGAGWNFAIYGLLHGIAVLTNHYYAIGLKRWLGREGFKSYNENPIIRLVAVCLTFSFCATSLFFFANSIPEMKTIISMLR